MHDSDELTYYLYRGDQLARLMGSPLIGQRCRAVRDVRGRCVRGRNGSMLVGFAGGLAVVPGRQLRKAAPIYSTANSTDSAVEPPASSSVTSSSS